jgi:hypothetical protein
MKWRLTVTFMEGSLISVSKGTRMHNVTKGDQCQANAFLQVCNREPRQFLHPGILKQH